jgi:DNA polymerase-1
MIMQVHDELVFEVPPKEVKALSKLAAEKMEGAAELKVRLRVDLSHGRTWAEAH